MKTDYGMLENIFLRDGFVHIERFLEPGEVDEIEANLARFMRDVIPTSSEKAMYQTDGKPETLKQISNLEIDPFFDRVRSRIQTLAETLLQQKVIPQEIQFFNKPPRIGTATPPHQDGYYFCLVPNEALTVWIALDDIDDENGALHYWKGSQKWGVLDHSESHVLGFSQGLTEAPTTDLGEETICRVKRGGCLVHHSLMVHAAGPNPSQRSRRAVGIVYYSEAARVDAASQRRYQESVLRQRSRAGN